MHDGVDALDGLVESIRLRTGGQESARTSRRGGTGGGTHLLDVLDDGDLEIGVEAVLCEELLEVVALVLAAHSAPDTEAALEELGEDVCTREVGVSGMMTSEGEREGNEATHGRRGSPRRR